MKQKWGWKYSVFEAEKVKYIESAILVVFVFIIFMYGFYKQQNNPNLKGKWVKLHDLESIEDDFFINSLEWHYDAEKEKMAACAVSNYAKSAGLEKEVWELTYMYSEDGMTNVFVRSQTCRELFLLLKKDSWLLIADIQRGNELENKLMENGWSYYSELDWNSYKAWTREEKEFYYKVKSDHEYYQYDSIYAYQAECAMQAYLFSIQAERTTPWEVMYERFFVSSQGCLADVWYTNEKHEVHIVIDVWNKLFTVIDVV